MNYWQPAIVAFQSNYLPAYKAADIYVPIRHYICRGFSTNQLLFMQNKPNLLDAQMNVNIYYTKVYKNESASGSGKNKPNSNPIKANFQKAQMNINSLITKDYRKNDDFTVRINKPNSKPISSKAKMNANAFSQKDYENETALSPKKTNPNKANFTYPQRHALSYAEGDKTEVRCRMSEVRCQMSEAKSQIIYYLSSVLCSLSSVLCFLMQPKLLNFHRKNSLTVLCNSVK